MRYVGLLVNAAKWAVIGWLTVTAIMRGVGGEPGALTGLALLCIEAFWWADEQTRIPGGPTQAQVWMHRTSARFIGAMRGQR